MVLLYLLGFSVLYFIKEQTGWFEKHIMRVGVGLGIFPVLAALFTITRVSLDWKVFLAVSAVIPLYALFKHRKQLKFPALPSSFKMSHLVALLVIVIFAFTFFMYHTGSFSYPYYEDGDPYKHAGAVKYIDLQKTALEPLEGEQIFHYLDSYPVAYDVLLALPYGINQDLMWNMKFFNSLILALGMFFMYFFVLKLTDSRKRALFSTFALAMIPGYLGHFIWAHALIVTLIPVVFYCLLKLKENPHWKIAALPVIGGAFLVQATQGFKLLIMIVIFSVLVTLFDRKLWKRYAVSLVGGGILSGLVWWGPMYLKYGGFKAMVAAMGTSIAGVSRGATETGFTLKFAGTADRFFTFSDFFYAQSVNMINNPIGIGVVLCLLMGLAILFLLMQGKKLLEPKNQWKIIAFSLLLFTFLGLEGAVLPVQLWSFRFWAPFSIFFAVCVSEGAFGVLTLLRKKPILKGIFILLIVGGIWMTSGTQKYDHNTNPGWPTAGEYRQYGNLEGWLWIKDQPADTRVFYACRQKKGGAVSVMGLGAYSCAWCADEIEFKKDLVNRTPEDIHEFLLQKDYKYLFIDGNCAVKDFDQNSTNALAQSLGESALFDIAHQSAGSVTFSLQ